MPTGNFNELTVLDYSHEKSIIIYMSNQSFIGFIIVIILEFS